MLPVFISLFEVSEAFPSSCRMEFLRGLLLILDVPDLRIEKLKIKAQSVHNSWLLRKIGTLRLSFSK